MEKEIGRPIKERKFVCVNARNHHENTKESLIRSVSLNTHTHSKQLIWQGLEPRAEFAYKMAKISWKCMKSGKYISLQKIPLHFEQLVEPFKVKKEMENRVYCINVTGCI